VSRTALEPASIDLVAAGTSPAGRVRIRWHQSGQLRDPRPHDPRVADELQHHVLRQHAPALPAATFERLVYERHREHHHDHACNEPGEQGVISPEPASQRVPGHGADEREQRDRGERSGAS
jgi:hypothetical protein